MSAKFTYECNDCGKILQTDQIIYKCDSCGNEEVNEPPRGILKINYDFNDLKKKIKNFDDFKKSHKNKFIDLLPLISASSLPTLRIGDTPLYKYENKDELYIKDDTQNPTYSYKDRASALVSAFAKEKKINIISAASTGNAGSSLAGICAAQGQQAIIFVPATAPKAKLCQIIMYGALLIPIDGNYDTAFDLCAKLSEHYGWYNRNTAFNPLTIEGKKIAAYEIYLDTQGKIPENIYVSVGDGVIISGLYKGFEDLLNLGLIEKMPKIIGVQSEKSKNIASNFRNDFFVSSQSNTLADSISVDIPRNYFMAKKYLLKYNGDCITVSDSEIISASFELSKSTGLFAEPAAAAAFAGYLKQKTNFKSKTEYLILLTGSGLKDIPNVLNKITIPEPISPNIKHISQYINTIINVSN